MSNDESQYAHEEYLKRWAIIGGFIIFTFTALNVLYEVGVI